jgi:hypothetical protein
MKKLKINIVNYEQGLGINAILTKYAKNMEKSLTDLGYEVEVTDKPVKADVHHHINYASYIPSGGIDTTMITHITGDMYTEKDKIEIIKRSLKTSTGICFSKGMKDKLIKIGCPKDKLEVVLPAHDALDIRPRIIALAYNIYPDGRKREEMFSKLIYSLPDCKKYAFRIMGKGWMPVLEELVKEKLQVQLVKEFSGEFYHELLNTSDYMLYTGGEDALPQSLIDAKFSNMRLIAPPQEDIEVDFPFNNQKELNDIFAKMVDNPVESWTWENYVKNHLKIWEQLMVKNTKKTATA